MYPNVFNYPNICALWCDVKSFLSLPWVTTYNCIIRVYWIIADSCDQSCQITSIDNKKVSQGSEFVRDEDTWSCDMDMKENSMMFCYVCGEPTGDSGRDENKSLSDKVCRKT